MKLAEALILRADLQKRIEQVKSRLRNNILVQEGERPSEEPDFLLKELFSNQDELSSLIKRINTTNNLTRFDDKLTLAEALVDRDILLERRSILANAAEEASVKPDRYSRTEIKYVSIIDVKEFQKEADKLSKEYRELDTKIQGLNWIIDLV
ncbi:DIP1984 family protein [Tissierella creatinophila]|uniref:Septicolysin n=1 Tax=Tissierella creatinophila DSM 6911 TaxID=1123403 RepID=A0A1U7M5Y8_TISCR|nr:DIP1984 family protein [Tissierella creatinophila]OLS02696.1 hypothetical protein TICRE_13410 [Tissierella creatinophila DSM 6911]